MYINIGVKLMKAIILKPIMWNTNQWKKPSGFPTTSGFSSDHGYGHEEWNNNPKRTWRNYKIFHTESQEKLLEYSKNGELGIIMIVSVDGNQYAVGIATTVFHNTQTERQFISTELNIYEDWKEAWEIDHVKNKFSHNLDAFLEHWTEHYQWVRWKCPIEQFHYFDEPIPLNPQRITGKSKLTSMHSSYQAIYPEQGLELVQDIFSENHPIIEWLSADNFDAEFVSDSVKKFWKGLPKTSKKKKRSSSNSPSERRYKYWVEGTRNVEPHHAVLQAKYVSYLKSLGYNYQENVNFVDVLYEIDNKKVIVEIKPTENIETRYAVRAGIGQLLEYQFRLNKSANLELVLGNKPLDKEIRFLKFLQISLTYYDEDNETFIRIPNGA